MNDIEKFLDDEGRIKSWPSKKALKYEMLKYLSTKFQTNHFYKEKEINEIIEKWHTFNDYFLLRRGLIDSKLLCRTKDGAKYWKEQEL